jgi:UDP-N-acetyl-2-amino-2-deoxyglucuronate dehydrogenase
MTKIKFAVIGYGNIGKRHVHHIMANPDAELVGICDLQTEKITSEELKSIPVFSDHVDMLKQVDAEVINVCTPNYLHSVHTVEALKTGRHVVCEKPMATSSAECQRMIEAAEKMDKTIFVVKQNRYNEPVQQVKKLLNEKALGAIYFVNINCFWNRNEYYYNESSWRGKKRDDGGCLFTQFSHFIDILYYLFGDIDGVQGKVKNFNHPYTEVEDSGAFVIENKLGSIINFNFSTCSYQKNMEGAITILGEKGTVKIGGQYLKHHRISTY